MYFMCRATQLTILPKDKTKECATSRIALLSSCSYIIVEIIYVIAVMHTILNSLKN